MKPSTAETIDNEINDHPPLARDALGNLLPLPEGTAAWRISRHTAGRPRVLTGPDGDAMRFPLSMTTAELVDLCGPDTYRVYALDELGEVLDFVATVQAARPRNANVPDVRLAALRGPTDAAPTTDLRFALHALTEIARINGEALRAISDSQADWIKTLAMNKGLPRNVAFPAMLPPPREERDDDEEDDNDRDAPEAEAEPADPNASPMMQFLSTVTPLIPGLVATWQGKKADEATIPVVIGDMTTATVPGPFSLVFLVFNGISNVLTQAEQVACFRNAARHLAPGGRFVIELWVPDLRRLPPGSEATVFTSQPGYIGLDTVDMLNQIVVSHHFRFNEANETTLFRSPHRWVWPAELDLIAQLAGFTLESRHADWIGSPFTAESRSHSSVYRLA